MRSWPVQIRLALGFGLVLVLAAWSGMAHAQSHPMAFSFGVIGGMPARAIDDAALREAIVATDADNLAFVVVNGVKSGSEPCSDKLYFKRKEVFQAAKNGLIISIAASDWSRCLNPLGQSVAGERLNRVRDLFFEDDFSFGASKLPLVRQASTPKFRNYVENARWDIGNVIFATINLPSTNNDFLPAAGRNAEFEDRLIADREWLHRVFGVASQRNAAAIVLFADGDPMTVPQSSALAIFGSRRDGFAEIRKQLLALSRRFAGKVLLVNGQAGPQAASASAIDWHGNLGSLHVVNGWTRINIDPEDSTLLTADKSGERSAERSTSNVKAMRQ